MEFTGKIKDFNNSIISIELFGAKQITSKLLNAEKLSIKIDKHREKRSLDANGLLWKACTVLAEALNTSKDDVYFEMLKRYGQTFVCKIPNEHIEKFKRQYKYCEQHEKLPPEERAQYFRVWLGSSNYNTKEMSVLLDGVMSEIEDMGLDFTSPNEVADILSAWEVECEKNRERMC